MVHMYEVWYGDQYIGQFTFWECESLREADKNYTFVWKREA